MGVCGALTLALLLVCWPKDVSAHVKWFADYNLVCPPRSATEIVSGAYFPAFCAVVVAIMFATVCIDRWLVFTRSWPARFAGTLTDLFQPYFPVALRLGVSAFFVAAASYGGFILTPELRTWNDRIGVVHLVIAGFALLPQTAFLAGAGVVFLFVYAVAEYGIYHLLDYPVFLGAAAFLIIDSLYGSARAGVALNILRLSAGITLMWAAIEKFAFPEWSFALLSEKPSVAFGFEPEFYMVAAGFVEFCCAWLLITGMLAERAAALVLLFFFVSAIWYFGVIDAIGHSVIIVVLALLALSRNPMAARLSFGGHMSTAALHTVLFLAALFLFIALYCGGHYLSYGPYQRLYQCLI